MTGTLRPRHPQTPKVVTGTLRPKDALEGKTHPISTLWDDIDTETPNIQELTTAVANLPKEEYDQLRNWFVAFENDARDRQMEADAKVGKFKKFQDEIRADIKAGKYRPLPLTNDSE